MDFTVIDHLSIFCDFYDISQEDWDSLIDEMIMCILETDEERQRRIYPVILSEYNPVWPEWFAEEKINLERLIGMENIPRISHYGSTSVPGLTAKPTIDILLEIKNTTNIDNLIAALPESEYICLNENKLTIPTSPLHLLFLKGYLQMVLLKRSIISMFIIPMTIMNYGLGII